MRGIAPGGIDQDQTFPGQGSMRQAILGAAPVATDAGAVEGDRQRTPARPLGTAKGNLEHLARRVSEPRANEVLFAIAPHPDRQCASTGGDRSLTIRHHLGKLPATIEAVAIRKSPLGGTAWRSVNRCDRLG